MTDSFPLTKLAPDPHDGILRLIAAFKLFKGILLLLLGLGALRLMHRDVTEVVRIVLRHVRADPDGRLVHALIAKVSGVSPKRLAEIGLGAFLYSSLFFTEGVGLLLLKRWAEWMAVITTGGFIPLEVYEVFHHFHVVRLVVLLVNVAIVIYLVREIRRKDRAKHGLQVKVEATPVSA